MNCQEALDLLYDIVDKEAGEIDTNEVKAHLENCRPCFEIYRVEEAVHDFIKEKVAQPGASPKLDALKSKILSNLDEVDLNNRSGAASRFFGLSTRTLAIAATLVLVIGTAAILYSFNGHYSAYIPIEKAHWAVEDNVTTFASSDQTQSAVSALNGLYNYDISQEVAGLKLVGAATETVLDVEMIHLVYSGGDRVVSVFVAPSELYQIPPDLEDSRIQHGDLILYDHNCRGCRLVFHQMGSAVIITATRDHSVNLLEFVPGRLTI